MVRLSIGENALFDSGPMHITPLADEILSADDSIQLLNRHLSGDWGEIDESDAAVNNDALKDGSRIMSVYTVRGNRIWIITDGEIDAQHHRYATTILLPEEY